jgi:hypothetical protein
VEQENIIIKSEPVQNITILDPIYKDLRDEIKKKDELIQVLSIQI